MEKGGKNLIKNQRYNYVQIPEFKNFEKSSINKFNYLSQSQAITRRNCNDNSLMSSISEKIKKMTEELKKGNMNGEDKKYNNDFQLRIERICKRGNTVNDENINKNNLKIKSKKDLNLNLMKNKLKVFENRREKDKFQKKNAFDELDDILNNFKNKRYGNK